MRVLRLFAPGRHDGRAFENRPLLGADADQSKQLSLPPFQAVQKPSFESFQVPWPRLPLPIGTRLILPSGENVILNLRLDGLEAVNGWPLKNVV